MLVCCWKLLSQRIPSRRQHRQVRAKICTTGLARDRNERVTVVQTHNLLIVLFVSNSCMFFSVLLKEMELLDGMGQQPTVSQVLSVARFVCLGLLDHVFKVGGLQIDGPILVKHHVGAPSSVRNALSGYQLFDLTHHTIGVGCRDNLLAGSVRSVFQPECHFIQP